MSTTSKSPRKVALVALAVAKDALPAYAHRFSPQKFTQHQLFACLALKAFFKTDYRGVTMMLADMPGLRNAIGLQFVPHFTTLQHYASRHEGLAACHWRQWTRPAWSRTTSAGTLCADGLAYRGFGRKRLTFASQSWASSATATIT